MCSCGALLRPAEVGTVAPHAVQDDGELTCHGDGGLLAADALHQPDTPGLERREACHPVEQHAGGLEQIGARQWITALGDPPRAVELTGLMAARRQAKIGADARGASEPAGIANHADEGDGGEYTYTRH